MPPASTSTPNAKTREHQPSCSDRFAAIDFEGPSAIGVAVRVPDLAPTSGPITSNHNIQEGDDETTCLFNDTRACLQRLLVAFLVVFLFQVPSWYYQVFLKRLSQVQLSCWPWLCA